MMTPTKHKPDITNHIEHGTRPPDEPGEGYVEFGAYRLDLRSGELWREGQPVRLRRQPSRLLALLVRRPNRLINREEIIRHLWGDRIVEYDQGLHACVRQIREALGDNAANPKWIETLPRSGYRFIGRVRMSKDGGLKPSTNLWKYTAAHLAAVACLVFTAALSRRDDTGAHIIIEASRDRRDIATAIAREAQLVFGIDLPRVSLTQHGEATGRLVVMTGNADTSHLASLDAIISPDQLSVIAAQALAATVRTAVPVDTPPNRVRDIFRQAEFVVQSHDNERLATAIDLLNDVISEAPAFAPAHSAIAHVHLRRGEYPLARRAAERALAIDSDNAAAHMTLANIALYADWDRRASAAHHRSVLERFPGWSMAHVSYAYLLSGEGRHDEALAHARLALALDPVSPIVHGDLGLLYLLAGRFDKATQHCRRTLELDPAQWVARACLVDALLVAGDSLAAQKAAVQFVRALSADDATAAAIGDGPPSSSFEVYWRWTLTWALRNTNRWYPYFAARAYVGLGEFDNAVATLLRAADEHTAMVTAQDDGGRRIIGTAMFPALRVDPRFAPLHGDIRFAGLVSRIAGG